MSTSSKLMKNGLTSALAATLSLFIMPSFATAQSENLPSQSWNDSSPVSRLTLPFKLRHDKLIHTAGMKNTPVAVVIQDICTHGGMTAIIDKSVEDKRITGTYADALGSELLASILSSTGLQADLVTDDLVLIQAQNAEHLQYEPSNAPWDILPEQESSSPASVRHKDPVIPPPSFSPSSSGLVPPPPPVIPSESLFVPPPPTPYEQLKRPQTRQQGPQQMRQIMQNMFHGAGPNTGKP